jgi:putative glutamine amidotransferase
VASNGSSPTRPVIGITTYLERAAFAIREAEAPLLPREYVDMVVRAGGVPVLLPPVGNGFAELVSTLDGLVLSGGADVAPDRYGQPAHGETTGLRPDRDEFEFGLLRAALAADLPVLAVCRGLQVLNVELGGTLHQHLPELLGRDTHRPSQGGLGSCGVALVASSRTADVLGAHTTVRCFHHQALDRVADGLVVTGRADDGTVEAVEGTGPGFVLGVQWHPEQNSEDDRLMAALVAASARRERP